MWGLLVIIMWGLLAILLWSCYYYVRIVSNYVRVTILLWSCYSMYYIEYLSFINKRREFSFTNLSSTTFFYTVLIMIDNKSC